MTDEQVATTLTDHDDRLKVVEKGVSNFLKFQSDINRKIGFVYGATWVASIACSVFLVVLGWALTLIVPAAKVVIEDYYRHHPNVEIQQKTVVSSPLTSYDAVTKMSHIATK